MQIVADAGAPLVPVVFWRIRIVAVAVAVSNGSILTVDDNLDMLAFCLFFRSIYCSFLRFSHNASPLRAFFLGRPTLFMRNYMNVFLCHFDRSFP